MFKVQASSGLSWADHTDMSESLPYPRTPWAGDAVTPFQILSAQGRYMRLVLPLLNLQCQEEAKLCEQQLRNSSHLPSWAFYLPTPCHPVSSNCCHQLEYIYKPSPNRVNEMVM